VSGDGEMTNSEVRQWYLNQIAPIPQLNEQWILQGLSAKERAEAAWVIRRNARLEARLLMAHPAEVELLRARDMAKYGNPDGPTFEYLVEQVSRLGLKDDDVYETIIAGSYRTNENVNKTLDF